jgi:hypothetical protein
MRQPLYRRRSSVMLDLVVSVQHARLVDELQRPPAVSRRPGAQSATGRVGDHVRTERYRGGRRSAASTLRLDRFLDRHQLAVVGARDPDVAAVRELQKLARPIVGQNEVTSPPPRNSGTFAICSGVGFPTPAGDEPRADRAMPLNQAMATPLDLKAQRHLTDTPRAAVEPAYSKLTPFC